MRSSACWASSRRICSSATSNGSFPLNDDGLTLGLNAAGLNYEVVAPAYKFSRPKGSSDSFGSDLQYQLVRAPNHNLSIGLTLLRKNFTNDNIAGRVGDYHVYDALVFANANVYDRLAGDAVSTASVSAGRGWVEHVRLARGDPGPVRSGHAGAVQRVPLPDRPDPDAGGAVRGPTCP